MKILFFKNFSIKTGTIYIIVPILMLNFFKQNNLVNLVLSPHNISTNNKRPKFFHENPNLWNFSNQPSRCVSRRNSGDESLSQNVKNFE